MEESKLFSTMPAPAESISFCLSIQSHIFCWLKKPCIFIIRRAFLNFFALYIERFLPAKFILQNNTRLFCKVVFSPDKFRLFFLWQIIEYIVIENIIYLHFPSK